MKSREQLATILRCWHENIVVDTGLEFIFVRRRDLHGRRLVRQAHADGDGGLQQLGELECSTMKRIWTNILILGVFCPAFVRSGVASELTKAWSVVYAELNGGALPSWRSADEARKWIIREESRVEPIILAILKGERSDMLWTSGLPIAKTIPTRSIRDVLLDRVTAIINRTGDNMLLDPMEIMGTASILDILSNAHDTRVAVLATDLSGRHNYPPLIIEESIQALRRVGNANSLDALRETPLRRTNEHIDREAALSERMITARLKGEDIFANANEELRALTDRYRVALETKNPKEYVEVHLTEGQQVLDEQHVQEAFAQPELADIVRSLGRLAPTYAFLIDRDNLQASLVVEDRYKVTYVYELEGWKVAGIERVGP